MTAYGISEGIDLSLKDPLVALTIVLARVMFGYIRDRHSKVSVVIFPQAEGEKGTAEVFPMEEYCDESMNSSYIA